MFQVERAGVCELAVGGVFYVVGVVFFKSDGLVPFAHAIWHLFVAAGACIHYYAIWRYLYLPESMLHTSRWLAAPTWDHMAPQHVTDWEKCNLIMRPVFWLWLTWLMRLHLEKWCWGAKNHVSTSYMLKFNESSFVFITSREMFEHIYYNVPVSLDDQCSVK